MGLPHRLETGYSSRPRHGMDTRHSPCAAEAAARFCEYPKLQGFELLSYSPNINYEDASEECLTEVQNNRNTVETAIKWAKTTEGIVSFCFHWFSPIGGNDKSFYSIHTDFDPSQVLIDGTPERAAFYHDLAVIAEELRRFQKENIPIQIGRAHV